MTTVPCIAQCSGITLFDALRTAHQASRPTNESSAMDLKTNFSFEVQYAAQSDTARAKRDEVMSSLGPSLQGLFAADDSAATVVVSDSHKGSDNRIVELVTTLQDAQIAKILKTFCDEWGVIVTALE